MTDIHCHVTSGDAHVRELIIGRDFVGFHPWDAASFDPHQLAVLTSRIHRDPRLGVGEIGLDRLNDREVTPAMRNAFEMQLILASMYARPVALHGAKCWGEVVRTCQLHASGIPAFLFHGFSRSDGLLPDIAALNGFVSVGPAVLNDHAVNYHALVRKIPDELLLLETDRTVETAATCPPLGDILAKVAALRETTTDRLEALTDANAERFFPSLASEP